MARQRKNVVIGFLGSTLDAAGFSSEKRWSRWRPTISLCQHEEFLVNRIELLHEPKHRKLAEITRDDIRSVSPETTVVFHEVTSSDWWDFAQVYSVIYDFSRSYHFDREKEEYYIHITTGTHVAQICLFLLTESHWLPGKLLQSEPPRKQNDGSGFYKIIDLDLSRYDALASRFHQNQVDATNYLKQGIKTRNKTFNALIDNIENVAVRSTDPILLTGPTGAGKSQLARRIYELKKVRQLIKGDFVEVNSATLRGDQAMSALFGHVKGAFTGAATERAGLLKKAHHGMLFLDEIGDLNLDEQAMLLKALEEKIFLPVGSDVESESDFQLIAGTNHNLHEDVRKGLFRDDLLARINLWTFALPSLRNRPEDIEPNIDFELDQFASRTGQHITFNTEARRCFLTFALSATALWSGNFRDLNGAIRRMATLAEIGRIDENNVKNEILRLKERWYPSNTYSTESVLETILPSEYLTNLDRFDRVQLADVVTVCKECGTLSEAGRILFSSSRERKNNVNDADRLRKYLLRFELNWDKVKHVK